MCDTLCLPVSTVSTTSTRPKSKTLRTLSSPDDAENPIGSTSPRLSPSLGLFVAHFIIVIFLLSLWLWRTIFGRSFSSSEIRIVLSQSGGCCLRFNSFPKCLLIVAAEEVIRQAKNLLRIFLFALVVDKLAVAGAHFDACILHLFMWMKWCLRCSVSAAKIPELQIAFVDAPLWTWTGRATTARIKTTDYRMSARIRLSHVHARQSASHDESSTQNRCELYRTNPNWIALSDDRRLTILILRPSFQTPAKIERARTLMAWPGWESTEKCGAATWAMCTTRLMTMQGRRGDQARQNVS